MEDKENLNEIVKTNIYFTRKMHNSLKMMAVLTRSSMSQIVREATRDKLDKLKKDVK